MFCCGVSYLPALLVFLHALCLRRLLDDFRHVSMMSDTPHFGHVLIPTAQTHKQLVKHSVHVCMQTIRYNRKHTYCKYNTYSTYSTYSSQVQSNTLHVFIYTNKQQSQEIVCTRNANTINPRERHVTEEHCSKEANRKTVQKE